MNRRSVRLSAQKTQGYRNIPPRRPLAGAASLRSRAPACATRARVAGGKSYCITVGWRCRRRDRHGRLSLSTTASEGRPSAPRQSGRDHGDLERVRQLRLDHRSHHYRGVLGRVFFDRVAHLRKLSPSDRSSPAVMFTNTPRAPLTSMSSSKRAVDRSLRGFSRALFSPEA